MSWSVSLRSQRPQFCLCGFLLLILFRVRSAYLQSVLKLLVHLDSVKSFQLDCRGCREETPQEFEDN